MTPLLLALALAAPPDAGDALPPDALLRLGTHGFRATQQVSNLAVSPDGRRVAFPTGTGVSVRDTATGREVAHCRLRGTVAFSPDGRTLAVGQWADQDGKAAIILYDSATGLETARLAGHTGGVVDRVAFAGDNTLVTGGRDKLFRVWDLPSGREVRQFPRVGRYYPDPFAVSADGRYLAAVDREDVQNQPLHVWEIASGREVLTQVIPDLGWGLVFSPDGHSLVCAGNMVRWYELPSGREKGRWEQRADRFTGGLVCSNDGPYVLSVADGTLSAWDLVAGRIAAFPLRLPVSVADRSAAGVEVFATGRGRRLEVWDLKTGRPRHPTGGHTEAVAAVAFAPDGRFVTADTTTVRRWDAAGREELVRACRTTYRTYCSALSTDGRTFANGDAGKAISLWDTATGRKAGTATAGVGAGGDLTFAPDGRTLACPAWDGGLYVWELAGPRQLWVTRRDHGRKFSAAAFAPDGRTLFSTDHDGTVRQWDVASGKELRRLEGHPEFMTRPQPFKLRRLQEPQPGHVGPVAGMAVTPDGRRLVSFGRDRTLRVWELASGKECALLVRAAGPATAAYAPGPFPVAVSPDGLLAVPGDWSAGRHPIDLWDLRAGRRLRTSEGHGGEVAALAFSPDGRRLLSGSADTTAIVWAVAPLERPAAPAPDEARQAALWADLTDPDAAKAYRALGEWLAAPAAAVSACRRRLPPARPVPADRVPQLVADLDSEQYAVRERASNDLRALGPAIEEPLRRELARSPSVEVTRRIEAVLAGWPDAGLLAARAAELLEAVATPGARALLGEWAKGAPDAALTREAAASLQRLERRP